MPTWPASLPPFHPPWWLRSGHAQTLAAAYWPSRLPVYRAAPRRVELSDGDVLIVHDDCPPDWQPHGTAVLLLHGLGGCHLSPLLVRLVDKLTSRGVRVFRLDLRGCGAGAGLARRPYHAGCSEDVAAVVASLVEWCSSAAALVLCGVSLGGNILLKYLGEAPERVPAQVVRALAVNPPIDLARSVGTLSGAINRWYDWHFVSALVRHLHNHRRRWPNAPMPPGCLQSRRLFDFDDRYTAPVSGFTNAAEYYARCSAAQFIPHIRVPTLVLTARDDPMVPVAMFESCHGAWPATVRLEIAAGGGHVGYLGRRGTDPDGYWLEWHVVEAAMMDRPDG